MRKKDLISGVISNELTKVFDTLNSLLSRDSSLLEEVVMLEARYNQTISYNHKGMVNRGEYNVEINQIKAGVLTLINSVGHLLDKDERELFVENRRSPYVSLSNNFSSDEKSQLSIIENPTLLLVTSSHETTKAIDDRDWEIMNDISKSINLSTRLLPQATVNSFTNELLYNKYDIVQLNVYDVGFNNGILLGEKRISFDAIVKLLRLADVKLLVLASCNSVSFAVKLNGVVNMIAGTGGLGETEFQQWEQVFFKLLLSGKELSKSFELSTSLVEIPICLMLSKDLKFR